MPPIDPPKSETHHSRAPLPAPDTPLALINAELRHERREMVNHPRHYNAHPSGIECIEVVERMTFNLGNACKYLWRGGLKASDPTEDYRKALWYVARSFEHDPGFLFYGAPVDDFTAFMLTDNRRERILARPSPWCEPIRNSIAFTFDLHSGRVVGDRIVIYTRLRECIQTAIDDEACLGRSMEP